MIPNLVVTQPVWLAAATVSACALAALVPARSGRNRAVHAALAAAGSAALASLLVWWGGPNAQTLLMMGAAAGGAWLIVEFARRQMPEQSLERRAALLALRLVAWVVLLTLLARPACDRRVLTYDKPVLAVLLDDSMSMAIVDQTLTASTQAAAAPANAPAQSRAARANAALSRADAHRRRLAELYDVRVETVGGSGRAADDLLVEPVAPVTAIAVALRNAAELRSAQGEPPVAVLLISDGAENSEERAAVGEASEALARQGTALLAVGVGPEPGQTPLVAFEPLRAPSRAALRDRLSLSVGARIQGCAGQAPTMEILWNDDLAASAPLQISAAAQYVAPVFELVPPGPGAHRLTARIAVNTRTGEQTFATSAVVDVVADRARVLWIEQSPRNESAFATRALRGDANLEVTQRFLFDDPLYASGQQPADPWLGHDVILLGRTRPRLSRDALATLADAVSQRGAGLLLVGGAEMFNGGEYAGTPLEELCPVDLDWSGFGLSDELRLRPTMMGLRHPVLYAPGRPDDTGDGAWPDWADLPPLVGAAEFGQPRPAAVVLVADSSARPLLVAQTVGRGRVIAAAWEGTWPWVLASDQGRHVHHRLWRQMVGWLANRRPQAWIVTDRLQYARQALITRRQSIRIRAGVSAPDRPAAWGADEPMSVVLTLRPKGGEGGTVAIPLRRVGDEWLAELPAALSEAPGSGGDPASGLSGGVYELQFAIRREQRGADRAGGPENSRVPEELTARTTFVVVGNDLEQRAPTADLGLMRVAAERTSEVGGAYGSLSALPALLERLTEQDRRRPVERVARYDIVTREPWGLLAWLCVALGLEWLGRKRSGLV